MSALDKATIENIIGGVNDPHTDASITKNNTLENINIDGDKVSLTLALSYPAQSAHAQLANLIETALTASDGINTAKVEVKTEIQSHEVQEGTKPLEGVKNIIAVASGKGGVGKSTVSANLALALAAEGAKVGILDADIYGPSQPRMFGLSGQPQTEGNRIKPMVSYDIQTMSIGYLIDDDTPMIWRGPMVTQALEQLLRDTMWQDLDYLIIDLPPGTGDIQLTLAQKVPVSGSLIVTTPQDIALIDARKAVKMFEKVEIPILGIIENMSTHICTNCGHEEHIFGEGGGQRMSDDYAVDFLGNIPLDGKIRENMDNGTPTVVSDPDSAVSDIYKTIARKASAKLSNRKKDYSAAFPNIVIQQN